MSVAAPDEARALAGSPGRGAPPFKGDPGYVRYTGNGLKDWFLNACGPDEERSAPTALSSVRGRASRAQTEAREVAGRSAAEDLVLPGAPTPDLRLVVGLKGRDLSPSNGGRSGRTS